MGDNVNYDHRTDTENRPGPERLVGVYRDEQDAREAAEAARAAGAEDVEIAGEADRVAALRGEMRDEVEHAWGGPSVGIYTKEMARNVPLWTAAASVVGALVALPFALFQWGELSLLTRLLIAAFSGAVFGGTIGFLAGGGFFDVRRKSRERLAAEQGVVVGARHTGDDAARAMANEDAIRVDRVASDGQPAGNVTTE